MDNVDPEYYISVVGEETDIEIICDNENNIVYSPSCKVSNISLSLRNVNSEICTNDQIDWVLLDGTNERVLGSGVTISLSDGFNGLIQVRKCGADLLVIDKRLHDEIPEIVFRAGCLYDPSSFGQYAWDDTEQIEFRNHGYYDFGRYPHPKGHTYYSPILSLVKDKSVDLRIDKDLMLKQEYERDPNFFIEFKANSVKLTLSKEKIYYSDLTSNTLLSLTSKVRIPGGNAKNPFTIEAVDYCERKIGQLKVASGKPQKIDVTIVPIHFEVTTTDYYSDNIGEIIPHGLYTDYSSFENSVNKYGFHPLFREFKLKEKPAVVLKDKEFLDIWEEHGERWLVPLRDAYELKSGDVLFDSSFEFTDFIIFVFNLRYFSKDYYVEEPFTTGGACFPARGEYGNITQGALGWIGNLNYQTFIHELGHGLQLCHTFIEEDGSIYPTCEGHSLMDYSKIGQTCDMMDYSNGKETWFFNHWLKRL